jgi:hypothetical protein
MEKCDATLMTKHKSSQIRHKLLSVTKIVFFCDESETSYIPTSLLVGFPLVHHKKGGEGGRRKERRERESAPFAGEEP